MECIIPCGTLEMVINLHEDEFCIHRSSNLDTDVARFRGAIASGAYSGPFIAETRAHASILGVHFKPGGANAILGVPAGELANTHVELEALWGHRAVSLRDRLCATPHAAERFRILEEALVDRLVRSLTIRDEIHVAIGKLAEPDAEVRDVARELQLSHRRFIELFSEQVGMTPKRYSRIVRFQRALERVTSQDASTWTQVALECGYFDQPHLCHDWIEFTGFSPADFLRRRGVRVKEHHLALPEPTRSNFSNTPGTRRA
jgi:AraC-like DNA-binding protein